MRCCVAAILCFFGVAPSFAGDRCALVIGVHQYDRNQLRSLPYAESDAVAIADRLKAAGFRRVVLMTQTLGAKQAASLPTAKNIRESLEGFLDPKTWNEDDTALVVLSGHGVQFKENATSYFCPMDASLENKETLVSLQDIYGRLEKCPAAFRLLVADCCRNDPQSDFSRSRSTVDLESVTRPQQIKPPGGVAALFSCSEGERAFESEGLKKGIFTHFFLESLRNPKADTDDDGRIDLEELVRFTRRNVTDYVKNEFGEKTIQVPELLGKTRGTIFLVDVAGATAKPEGTVPRSAPAPTIRSALVDAEKAGEVWEGNGLKMKFCWCPAGEFKMGSPESEPGRARQRTEEQVDVELSGFWLGKFEVTQQEWKTITGTTLRDQAKKTSSSSGISGEGPDYPMYFVNHDEATEFAQKLTQQERTAGRLPATWEYRLPTEAQWEYGCRAGTTEATAFGNMLSGKQANFYCYFNPYNGAEKVKAKGQTTKVNEYSPNAWGLHDMHGNVQEWCRDWSRHRLPGGSDPEVVDKDTLYRVIRGGSWDLYGSYCRSAYRGGDRPTERSNRLGLRLAIVRLPPEP
jgi:formylglycine-generating enzyme required for sulfatase activity